MLNNCFSGQYENSIRPELIEEDIKAIKDKFINCQGVEKTGPDEDKKGVDYLVHLNKGRTVGVDVKRREIGAGRWWKDSRNPDLALEVYSVVEQKKIGWTLKEESQTDYILFLFDKSDSEAEILVPFQLLRLAFIQNGKKWIKEYKYKKQNSFDYYGGVWKSSCVFVPADVVLKAISELMFKNQMGH